jgi:cyclic pyranopterin phosphate synthase
LYQLDEVGPDLKLLPMAARRALDRVGIKVPLAVWQTLPLVKREQLAEWGSQDDVPEQLVQQWCSEIEVDLPRCEVRAEPSPEQVPEELLQRLGPERPLPLPSWAALEPLDRYALLKVVHGRRPERVGQAYDELIGRSALSSHLDTHGGARMVNIGRKEPSLRRAVAESRVRMNPEAFARLRAADVPKGDVFGTARLAGIMAAKKTADLIPLCHPLHLTRVEVTLALSDAENAVEIETRVEAFDRTGVEMEALVAASTAALTVYDMLKSFDRGMVIGPTQLVHKSGGRTGDFQK